MAATGVQYNWANVQFANGTIKFVTDIQFKQSANVAELYADDSPWAQCVAVSQCKTTATLKSSDESAILAISIAATGTFTATHKDAKHAANGDIVYTLSNAVVTGVDTGGGYGKFGDATLQLQAFSADGSTPPLSYSRA